jgi:tetratricopeptide (TPR) repeat protein
MRRLFVDISENGAVYVRDGEGGWPVEGVTHLQARPPLDADELEDLRWYLEDYVRAPFGAYADRGLDVERRLAGWGEKLFASVFGTGLPGEPHWQARELTSPFEMLVTSASPKTLGLPWELMRDPAEDLPLALRSGTVGRCLPEENLLEAFAVPRGRLRLLMVISRPAAAADVGYQMIARPLLRQLRQFPGAAEVVVLRPPTLEALGTALSAAVSAGEPFHIVHFDGHGSLAGEGKLAFQRVDGRSRDVPASRVAEVLAAGGVPLVILNACQSGAIGRELEAAVATRLLRHGAAAVVAMAYTVSTTGAAKFMAGFYGALFSGKTVSAAVAAGRSLMFTHNLRPSPRGDVRLADWLIPVHYLRQDLSFEPPPTSASATGAPDGAAEDPPGLPDPQGADDPLLGATGELVGRDSTFYELEAAMWPRGTVVVHGPAGTGKTELAKAFGRWWRDTGGVGDPEWVWWHSFEPGAATARLDGVLEQIGRKLFGSDFDREAVLAALADRRMLLIWDNFEYLRSMPDQTTGAAQLDDGGREEYRDFLELLGRGSRTSVLITSRGPEDWLGDVRRVRLGGLEAGEAAEYASQLLARDAPAAPSAGEQAYSELMEWLAGHPLSMRVILPLLETTSAEALLDGLRGASRDWPLAEPGSGETASVLAASITRSFSQLHRQAQRILPLTCLFQGVADASILDHLSDLPGLPERFRATPADWRAALESAAAAGILTARGSGAYEMHPYLSAYLAAEWHGQDASGYDLERESATKALLAACASLCARLTIQAFTADAAQAFRTTSLNRGTFGVLLSYALRNQLWEQALAIVQPLSQLWDNDGADEEASAWGEQVLAATGHADGTDPWVSALRLLFVWKSANRNLRNHRLDDAEDTYRQILTTLLAQPVTGKRQQDIAGAYHQLGMVAEERERFREAEEWYSKARTIRSRLGVQRDLAETYLHLGKVASRTHQLRAARRWYGRALDIQRRLNARPGMAITYHQLGVLAQRRGRLAEAEQWYLLGLRVQEVIGNKPGIAMACQQLGAIAIDQRRWDAAQNWYLRALSIQSALNDAKGTAVSYHQLGIAAHLQGRFVDAERWYTQSMDIAAAIGDQPGVQASSQQLSLLAANRSRFPR